MTLREGLEKLLDAHRKRAQECDEEDNYRGRDTNLFIAHELAALLSTADSELQPAGDALVWELREGGYVRHLAGCNCYNRSEFDPTDCTCGLDTLLGKTSDSEQRETVGLRKAQRALLENLETVDVEERTVTLTVSTALWENWQDDTRHHPDTRPGEQREVADLRRKLASSSLTIAALRTALEKIEHSGCTEDAHVARAVLADLPADSLAQEVVKLLRDARGMAHRHYIYDECQDCGMLRGSIDALLAQIGGKT